MATREQLIDALRRADAAGDVAAAQAIARKIKSISETPSVGIPEMLKRPEEQIQPSEDIPRSVGVPARGAVEGISSGLDAIISAPYKLAQLAGAGAGYLGQELGSPSVRDFAIESTEFATREAPKPVTRLMQLVGALPEQYKPQTTAEQYSAAAGGAIGGSMAGGGINPQSLTRSLASAAGAGLGAQAATEIAPDSPLAQLGGAMIGSKAGDFAGGVPESIRKIIMARPGAPMPSTPLAQTVATSERAGVTPTTTDVFPPTTRIGRQAQMSGEAVPFIGTGPVRAAQQTQRSEAVQKVVSDYGADYGKDFSKVIADDLISTKSAAVNKYAQLKEGIKQNLMGAGSVPVSKVTQQIDDEIAAITRKFSGNDAKAAISELKTLKNDLASKNLTDLEDVRKVFGEKLASPDSAGVKSVLDKGKDRIYSALKTDIESFVKQNAGGRGLAEWKLANGRLSQMIDESKRTSLGKVLNKADMTPEAVKTMLSSANPSDVRRLYQNLSETGRAAGRSAVIQNAYDSSFRGGSFSPDAFVTALSKEMDKSGYFFNNAQRRQLEGLKIAFSATSRAPQAAQLLNNGGQVAIPATISSIVGLSGGSAGAGLLTFGTIGALARAYESKPVRDFLIKLSAMPKDKALKEAERLIPLMQLPAQSMQIAEGEQ